MSEQRPRSVPPVRRNVQKYEVRLYMVDQIGMSIRTVAKWCGIVATVYFAGQALAPFANGNTIVSVALSLAADFKFTAAVTLAGAAGVWAIFERMLRRRKTEYLQDRIKQLEERVDPERSSSELQRSGETNPKDRRE